MTLNFQDICWLTNMKSLMVFTKLSMAFSGNADHLKLGNWFWLLLQLLLRF